MYAGADEAGRLRMESRPGAGSAEVEGNRNA
jgi:hypothetical protein